MKFINWPLVFPLFVLAFVAGAAPSVATNYLDLKFAHDFPESQTQPKRPGTTYQGTVTWYGIWKTKGVRYDGQETASGVIFRQNKITFAAPVEMRNGKAARMKDGRYKPIVPFGTLIKVAVNGKAIQGPVTDTCIGGTWDTSAAGMKGLGFSNPQQKLPGAIVEVVR